MPIELKVDIKGDKELMALLQGMGKQLPYATAMAMKESAFESRAALQDEIRNVFDAPVSFVVRSPKVDKPTKRRLIASVYIDERVQDSLIAQVEGGPRLPRDVARRMYARGHLKSGEYTTYNRRFANRSGNVTLNRWKTILAELGKKQGRYFIATINGLKAIWIRQGAGGRKIAPVVFIVRRPTYTRRFDFYRVAEDAFFKSFDRNFDKALARAIKTAR